MESTASVLVIYTGGTIGMVKSPETGALKPIDLEALYTHIPILESLHINIDFHTFEPLVDSSDMKPSFWIKLAELIAKNYENYDGFVVLHGSDTMAYTASALSFLLENLNKAVVLTGSQIPLGVIRTDGRDNLINSLEIAADKKDDIARVPEVCIYFEDFLFRGNRTTKLNAENFNAFYSGNYPHLAEIGVNIKYNQNYIRRPNFKKLKMHSHLSNNVGILKLFPGISPAIVENVLKTPGLEALILETFGSGNAPTDHWFLEALEEAVGNGLIMVNVTQCKAGSVEIGMYDASVHLGRIGIISGYDITTESALTKMMYLLGSGYSKERVRELLQLSLRGEMTIQ